MTEQELEKLYTDSYKAVYWTAMSLLKNKEEAEDVVQETFLTAYSSYDSLKDKSKAVAWVKKIAANKCLNILTRTRTVNTEDEFFDNVEAVPEDFLPESLIESDEKRKIIMDLIDKCLSDDSKMTIILFYFNELSVKEIAERLNIPQGTVLSRLNYAKKKIKKEVEDYEDKNKDKLFAMGLPFLTLLFEKEASQVPMRPMPLPVKNIAASSASKASAGTAKSMVAKSAAKSVIIKNTALVIAGATILGGGGYVAYKAFSKDKDADKTHIEHAYETDGYELKNVLGVTPDMLDLTGGYIRHSTYELYSNEEEEHGTDQYYNADGQMILECLYSDDGELYHSDYYIYDDEGRVVYEESWDHTARNRTEYKEYTYCAYGIERIYEGSYDNEPEDYYEYEYDSSGRLIKVTNYKTQTGDTYWYCDYEYLADGSYNTHVTSFDYLSWAMEESSDYNYYSSDGILLEDHGSFRSEWYNYIYRSNGDIDRVEHYYGSDLSSTEIYEYDDSGRLVSRISYDTDDNPMWAYMYDYEDL